MPLFDSVRFPPDHPSARVDAAQAQVETARALFNQATDLKQGGIVAGIDVLRAEVQLGTERQRATVKALGLRKLHQVVEHSDSPVTRGMVHKVAHLVRILEDN